MKWLAPQGLARAAQGPEPRPANLEGTLSLLNSIRTHAQVRGFSICQVRLKVPPPLVTQKHRAFGLRWGALE